MTKVLFYGESPYVQTGLGQVAKHHIETFLELGYEVEAVCINHSPGLHDIIPATYPITLHPVKSNDEPWNIENMHEAVMRGDYDIIFLSADCQNIDRFSGAIVHMRGQKNFKVISYVAVDCDTIGPEPFRCMVLSDYAYTYTYHGQSVLKREIPNKEVGVIYLGCESELFHPIDLSERDKLRHQLFGADENTFIAINVGRNQWRKDMARSMTGFHHFHEKYPNSLLYMHAKSQDVGGNLRAFAKILGMCWEKPDPRSGKYEIYFTANDFNECFGIDRSAMNNIYNVADVLVSSSQGEGWGLSTGEAMAAGTPVLVPNGTANLDLIGNEDRGYLIDYGGMDLWSINYGHAENPRDFISVRSMVEKLDYIHNHREEAKAKAMKAREWSQLHTWEHFKDNWKEVLNEIS